ncbi:MAG TPA: LysE family translocator [Bosea sp. (in: a-proteobacteria)]|jgi:threonine/homoserine/homoserine lactone efflux protein|uniref:LysE family translocator n=1 Tax=Bosea sp. (in: a-proteobacteria) TaxID=1871050 RepID=UPI002E0E5AC7|nr:LysE family translocator [Bosea sp. (in: a-proteobacteria)]
MSLHAYLLFVASSIVLVLVPGPDMAYMLTRTVAQGRRAGSMAALGINAGAYVHLAAAIVGLSALLLASTTAFTIVKWAGAAYLCYLGIRAMLSRDALVDLTGSEMSGRSLRAVFWQGFWSDVLNPKVAIFYVALLPQFIDAQAGHVTMQLVLLGVTSNVVAIVINLGLVAGAAQLTSRLRRSARVALWLQRAMGLLFISLGVRLAAQKA